MWYDSEFNTNFYLNRLVLFRPRMWNLNIYLEDLYHRYIVVQIIQVEWKQLTYVHLINWIACIIALLGSMQKETYHFNWFPRRFPLFFFSTMCFLVIGNSITCKPRGNRLDDQLKWYVYFCIEPTRAMMHAIQLMSWT